MPRTDRKVLLTKLEAAKTQVQIGAKYRHTKTGGEYIVMDLVIREDNEEIRVIYKETSHKPPITWDRSFDGEGGWIIPAEIDGKSVSRFTKIT